MAEDFSDQALTPDESRFREFISRGDDFCKIEIYRQAVDWYRKAVELKPDDPDARKKLEECSRKIKAESRTILIILAIGVILAILAALVV
jgi:hypothetical protein